MAMKIIIACDSFKECLSSQEVADSLESGLLSVSPTLNVVKIAVADGGEGTITAILDAKNGHLVNMEAEGPLMQAIPCRYAVLGDNETVVIEMAETCGLTRVDEPRKNPLNTTSYGVGTQVKAALAAGYRKFIIGLGGTCTNDGGLGLLQSLGFRFYDADDRLLEAGLGGKQLSQIKRIESAGADARLARCDFTLATDVKNPLFGPNGAARIYGPQKGADAKTVALLDEGLINFSEVIKQTINRDISAIPGSGAAGGTAGGLLAFLNARIQSGIELVLQLVNFPSSLQDADLVITGEGKIDKQTFYGKVPYCVGQAAKAQGIRALAVCGRNELSEDALQEVGITKIYELSAKDTPLDIALAECEHNLINTGRLIAQEITKKLSG